MPKDAPELPNTLEALGVSAWRLPEAAMRQMETHSHAEAQIFGLDSGLAIVEAEAGSWLCPPGRCVWVPPDVAHSLRSCGKISGWMVHLDRRLAESLPIHPQVQALSPLLKQVVLRLTEWQTGTAPDEAKRRLVQVVRDEIRVASPEKFHLPTPSDRALKRLADRLAGGSQDVKGLAALAHEVGVSERSLFRKFQQETGLSPGQWRKQMQVLRALELLADRQSVTETALAIGYENTGAFIRAFRQVLGITPAVYQRTMKLSTLTKLLPY